MTDQTADTYPISQGMFVWNNNLDIVVVGKRQADTPYESGWYDMITPDGKRSSMMNGERMAVQHPSSRAHAEAAYTGSRPNFYAVTPVTPLYGDDGEFITYARCPRCKAGQALQCVTPRGVNTTPHAARKIITIKAA